MTRRQRLFCGVSRIALYAGMFDLKMLKRGKIHVDIRGLR